MSTVRAIAFVIAASLLAGCAPLQRATQTGCEESTRTFAELEGCLKKSVANAYTAREQAGNDVRYYFIKADDVAGRVRRNDISDFSGRDELRALYVKLRRKTEVQ